MYVSIRDLCVCVQHVFSKDTYVYQCMGYMYVSIRDLCVCVSSTCSMKTRTP